MDEFTEAYITAALFAETDNANEQGGEPLDKNYTADDIAPETLVKMKADCASFQNENAYRLSRWCGYGQTETTAGHDFWLTRNGHGAGFWSRFDKGLPAVIGWKLTDAAEKYGTMTLYVGDDGRIHSL